MPKFTAADALRIEKAWEDYTGQPAPYSAIKVLRELVTENSNKRKEGKYLVCNIDQ